MMQKVLLVSALFAFVSLSWGLFCPAQSVGYYQRNDHPILAAELLSSELMVISDETNITIWNITNNGIVFTIGNGA
jgi:hypothetical protein